jgi:biopolymer transport protein ExbD
MKKYLDDPDDHAQELPNTIPVSDFLLILLLTQMSALAGMASAAKNLKVTPAVVAAAEKSQPRSTLEVTLTAANEYEVWGRKATLDEVRRRIKEAAPGTTVVVVADNVSKNGAMMQVLSAACAAHLPCIIPVTVEEEKP